uniref:Uncharacterized protein n=1 Tax=Octopus bimaculoides TaxID=37653 RepID=A0A0L8H4I0_OCTBM
MVMVVVASNSSGGYGIGGVSVVAVGRCCESSLTPFRSPVIQTYVPTNEAADDIKEDFYRWLQTTIDKSNRCKIVIVIGKLSAKGDDSKNKETITWTHSIGTINNGDRLCNICSTNGLVITDTCFPQETWVSPDSSTRCPIDYILIKLKMKLHSNTGRKCIKVKFETQNLESETYRTMFNVESRNRFQALKVEEGINTEVADNKN